MTDLDLDNLIRITKIITNATRTHTIDHNHISSALKILDPNMNKYSKSAFDAWIAYQQTKTMNVYYNKAKVMLNEGEYRVKSDAAAYLSGIIIVHDDYIVYK
jgi:hypothetical protein